MNTQFKLFIGFMIVLVLGVIVAGFYLAGSPQQARMERFDQRRIQDLEGIANALSSYYLIGSEKAGKPLPLTLQKIKTSGYNYGSIQDPETNQLYEYRVLTPDSYELCATFSTSNKEQVKGNDYYSQQEKRWEHGIGRTCFQQPRIGKIN